MCKGEECGVCVYVCLYEGYVYACTYMYICILLPCVCVCYYACMYLYVCVDCECMNFCVHILYVHVCICINLFACVYAYTYIV